jgi:hypothetical protein
MTLSGDMGTSVRRDETHRHDRQEIVDLAWSADSVRASTAMSNEMIPPSEPGEVPQGAEWELRHLQALLSAYVAAGRLKREEIRRAQPGIDEELLLRRVLRSELRRN